MTDHVEGDRRSASPHCGENSPGDARRAGEGAETRERKPQHQPYRTRGRRRRGKIEPNTVLRGSLHLTTDLNLWPRAVAKFGRSATMHVASLPDLYGGKLCAAPDRQHPRALFDVHGLFQNEDITDDIRRAFVIFLASHDRPMSELLTPNRTDLKQVFADQFAGMTNDPVPLAALESAREQLIERINADLTNTEREFLLSMKRLEPKWDLLGMPGIERSPGPQWKLYILRKMDPKKQQAAEELLRQKIGL